MRSLPELVLPLRATTLAAAPRSAVVLPGAEAWYGGHGRVGVLLIHGFTGSPKSIRGWAEQLAADGFRVAVPRLPGHGTSWQELALTRWQDWYAAVEHELDELRATCDQVFVGGLSLGGCLALLLAERRAAEIEGVVLVNAVVTSTDRRLLALPVLRWLLPSLPGIANDIARPGVDEEAYARVPLPAAHSMVELWRETRNHLSEVRQPLLVFRSLQDHTVDPTSGRAILSAVRSPDVEEVLLQRSYHVATMDYEAEEIFSGSSAFIRRLLKD